MAALAVFASGIVFADTTVLFIAGEPSHGPGEHRFPDGCRLLADALNESQLGVRAEVSLGWPTDEALAHAQAVVIYSDGLERHVANGHFAALRTLVNAGRGLVVLHFALEPSLGEGANVLLEAVGAYFEAGWSVNPVWKPKHPVLASHVITQGVAPIEIEDEWYYHLRFRDGVTPVLQAVPTDATLGEDGPRSGNPAVRAAIARSDPQTLAWVMEERGRRAFGFTGGHYHRNWSDPNFRKLVLNAIVWTAGLPVPAGGVSSTVVAAPRYPTIDEAIARGDLDDVKHHVALDGKLLREARAPALAPLHQAILRNRTEIAEWLIEAGADPNLPDRSQRTPLHLAVERGNLRMVKFLLAKKVNPNERDKIGWTPLHHAAAKDLVEIAQALIAGGADPMTLSERGGTPLHEAAASGSVAMVQLLLDHGVDPAVVSAMGVTALDVAREFKNEPAIQLLSAPARHGR